MSGPFCADRGDPEPYEPPTWRENVISTMTFIGLVLAWIVGASLISISPGAVVRSDSLVD